MRHISVVIPKFGALHMVDLRFILIELEKQRVPENAAISFSYDGDGRELYVRAAIEDGQPEESVDPYYFEDYL